eukprot:scaffold656013_cov47-Prasinocladus_malaysianus.AAC.1
MAGARPCLVAGGLKGDSRDPLEWGRMAWDDVDEEVVIDGATEAEEANRRKPKSNFLPLELFMDPDLDPLSPEEW